MKLQLTVLLASLCCLGTACGGSDSDDLTGPGGDPGAAGSAGSAGSAGFSGAPIDADAAVDAEMDANDTGLPDHVAEDVLPIPDASPDAIPDAIPDAEGLDAEPGAFTSMGILKVDCTVPFILDASQVTSMPYMTSHFGHLVQQYGITGVIGGQDITAFPEKMYYGSHVAKDQQPNDVLSLMQISMAGVTNPTYSVRVDFRPDTAVTTGSVWDVGLADGQAAATLLKHVSTSQLCLMSVGFGGKLTFKSAKDTTLVEGGAFHVTGSMNMVVPDEVPSLCDMAAQINVPCCS